VDDQLSLTQPQIPHSCNASDKSNVYHWSAAMQSINQSINPSVSLYHSTSDFNARGFADTVISAIFDPAIAAEKLRESFNPA